MFTYSGQTALITGASSGIGEMFARQLAARGMNLVLVARSEGRLRQLAHELKQLHHVQIDVVPMDLSRPGAGTQVARQVHHLGRSVHLLINSAGFATHGRFEQLPMAQQQDEISLNITALVELTHATLPEMLARGLGGVINVASTAGLQPDPYMAVYGATKAFVLSFSEALWAETRGRGVTVTALCPGATDTAFFDVVGAPEASVGRRDTPQNVVRVGLRALERGQSHVIPGTANVLLAQVHRFLPRALTARIVAGMLRPRTPQPVLRPD
ncbi:SDR family oxidoreductase (plasmid) [Deinococcus taeanensis]|nr:SDR family oxidoreductase [Deinococcus taeanensis]UBV44814.1 SDR family oxidoreductase [Deinococcus taeanensis]